MKSNLNPLVHYILFGSAEGRNSMGNISFKVKDILESGNVNRLLNEKLIPGGQTASGKQKYKYVDKDGNIKEVLPITAKTKGYEIFKG